MALLAGCIGGEPVEEDLPIDEDLVVAGFDGLQVSGDGWWIRERIVWTDGSQPDEVHHGFVIGADVDPCADWWGPAEVVPAPVYSGDPVADCEADRAWYAAESAARHVVPDAIWFSFQLWDSFVVDEDHIGVPPDEGTYTQLDGPDADPVEFAFGGSRVLFDWYAEVAATLDCASSDPWACVPSDLASYTTYESESGSLTLDDPVGEQVAFALEDVIVVADGGAAGPGGVLDGVGVFTACDVVREITPSTPTD